MHHSSSWWELDDDDAYSSLYYTLPLAFYQLPMYAQASEQVNQSVCNASIVTSNTLYMQVYSQIGS